MVGLIKRLRILAIAAAIALVAQPIASVTTTTPAYAGDGTSGEIIRRIVTTGGEGGSSSGGWIVGGLVISVASIIACAMIVGAEEDREMTLEEALLSGAIPLGCLLREHLTDE